MNVQKEKTEEEKKDEIKPVLGKFYLLALSVIILIVFILQFVVLKVDPVEYTKYLLDLKTSTANEPLMQLNNANTITNLPNVVLQTGDENLSQLTDCKGKLKYLGEVNSDNLETYRDACKLSCGGSGELLIIEKENDYIFDNVYVKPGVYCTIKPTPCNFNTGYAVATVNSVTCKSKYPRMFGGTNATDIVACNDEKYPSTGSVLWDYLNNEMVDPYNILMTDEEETLPDGSYRFRCKFNESVMENPYIAHPLDRFHPIEDVCNYSIYRAPYSVYAKVDEKGWSCDCGIFEETRVSHLDKNDIKSTCTSCFFDKKETKYTMPYLCYRETASYTFAQKTSPCIEYLGKGNFCNTLELEMNVQDVENKFIFTKSETVNLNSAKLSRGYVVD